MERVSLIWNSFVSALNCFTKCVNPKVFLVDNHVSGEACHTILDDDTYDDSILPMTYTGINSKSIPTPSCLPALIYMFTVWVLSRRP